MTTDFQEKVLFWGGDNSGTNDEVMATAHTPEMDAVVTIIKKMFITLIGLHGQQTIGVVVWRNGICWDVLNHTFGRLGTYPELSRILYESETTLEAFQCRGNKEGFKIVRRSGLGCGSVLRSLVVEFVRPDAES